MIKLTRLDGSQILMNEDFIEIVSETPDTVITLHNGRNYIVKESMDEIIAKIHSFNKGDRGTGRFSRQ